MQYFAQFHESHSLLGIHSPCSPAPSASLASAMSGNATEIPLALARAICIATRYHSSRRISFSTAVSS